jgi:hypothetical protein
MLALATYAGGIFAAKKNSRLWRKTYSSLYLVPGRTPEGHPETKRELLALRPKLRPNDLVLTSNPWVTDYYLGRTDGFLRQRALGSRRFGTFSEARDEYFGTLIYDSPAKVDARLADLGSDQRIWLITEHKFREFSSASYRKYVQRSFARTNRSSRIPIYRSQ